MVRYYNKNYNDELIYLLQDKKYEDAINLIKNKSIFCELNEEEKYVEYLVNIINNLKNNDTILKPLVVDAKNIVEALNGRNFMLAYMILEDENICVDDNILGILLKEIKNLIRFKKNIKTLNVVDYCDLYYTIMHNIDNHDFESFYNNLEQYLLMTNKLKYKNLILDLIKKDSKIDSKYKLSKNVIFMIHNDRFKLQRGRFINDFNLALEKKDFDDAKLNLDIIDCLEDFKEEHTIYKRLEKLYLFSVNQTNEKTEEKLLNNNDYNPIYKKIEDMIIKLRNEKGIYVFEEMDEVMRTKIHEILKYIPDICSFSVGETDKKRIVMYYCTNYKENVDDLLDKANYFINNDIDVAIELYKDIISYGKAIPLVLSKIGDAYLKKDDKDNALKYFEIACELANKNGYTNSYLYLIEKIKCIKEKNEVENYKDFYNEEKVKEVLILIFNFNNTIEEACLKCSVTEEEINMVRLICAKEYYRLSRNELADKCMKLVERSKNKNKLINLMFNEIRKNKKLYEKQDMDEMLLRMIRR